MDEFLTSINSLYWWISVVVVGILINLASHYMQSNLDGQLSKLSTWWRKRSNERTAKRSAEVKKLIENPSDLIYLQFDEIVYRIRAILFFTCTVVMLLFVVIIDNFASILSGMGYILKAFLLFGSGFLILLSLHDHRSAMDLRSLIYEVRFYNDLSNYDDPNNKP